MHGSWVDIPPHPSKLYVLSPGAKWFICCMHAYDPNWNKRRVKRCEWVGGLNKKNKQVLGYAWMCGRKQRCMTDLSELYGRKDLSNSGYW
jgi:hypothetical protein